MTKNNRHAVVKPIQKYLNTIGYACGNSDGIFGLKSDSAIRKFQQKVVGMKNPDGEITAKKSTWMRFLQLS